MTDTSSRQTGRKRNIGKLRVMKRAANKTRRDDSDWSQKDHFSSRVYTHLLRLHRTEPKPNRTCKPNQTKQCLGAPSLREKRVSSGETQFSRVVNAANKELNLSQVSDTWHSLGNAYSSVRSMCGSVTLTIACVTMYDCTARPRTVISLVCIE